MKTQNDYTSKSNTALNTFSNTRRDFIKLCSAAAAGGFSSLLLPQTSEAKDYLELLKTGASQGIADERYWAIVRMHFSLEPGLIHMNTGTEGSMPRCVTSRIGGYFKEFAKNSWDALLNAPMDEARTKVAEFIGANFEETVLTTNTTEGICFTTNGLDWQEGDKVLTTHHFSPYNCSLFLLRDRKNITVTQLYLPTPATDKNEIVAIFEDAITPQTKVMCFCHINFTTGLRMPVKELCELARDHNIISVVDGAHAIGMLNLNLHDLGCDFYATSPHKWLNAPPGTGVFYMREDAQDLLWPTVTESYPLAKGANRFQTRGQQCHPIYAGLNDAIDFQNAIGKDKIQERIIALSTYLKEKIIENWGEQSLFSPMDEELSSGLVSFNPFDDHFGETGELGVGDLYDKLYEKNIITRTISFKDKRSDTGKKRGLRISTHIFNGYDEIDKVLDEIKTIIADL